MKNFCLIIVLIISLFLFSSCFSKENDSNDSYPRINMIYSSQGVKMVVKLDDLNYIQLN